LLIPEKLVILNGSDIWRRNEECPFYQSGTINDVLKNTFVS